MKEKNCNLVVILTALMGMVLMSGRTGGRS